MVVRLAIVAKRLHAERTWSGHIREELRRKLPSRPHIAGRRCDGSKVRFRCSDEAPLVVKLGSSLALPYPVIRFALSKNAVFHTSKEMYEGTVRLMMEYGATVMEDLEHLKNGLFH
uniref:DUF371 domain-containing protein n=1 Tax=Ascaris lumbricoides TaxID=6252 RepID=A0A0M3IX27_ASCLU